MALYHYTFKAIFYGAVAYSGLAIAQDVDYAQFVNPFIGSEGAISGYACTLNESN
jgi:hypothetical protein